MLPLADNLLHFEASGPLRLLGMGNGHPWLARGRPSPPSATASPALAFWSIRDENPPRRLPPDPARHADLRAWRDPFQWVPDHERPPRALRRHPHPLCQARARRW